MPLFNFTRNKGVPEKLSFEGGESQLRKTNFSAQLSNFSSTADNHSLNKSILKLD